MPVPAVVATDLVVVEADFALAGLEGLLDCPAAAGDVDEVAEAGGGRPVAEVVGEISRVGQAAPHQQPVPVAGGLPDRLPRPVVDPRALGPGTGGDTFERLRRQGRRECVGTDLGGAGTEVGPQSLAGRDRQHVRYAAVL